MRIAYENLLKKYGAVTATQEDPNYPVMNLYDQIMGVLYRAPAGVSGSVLTISFTEDETVSVLALGKHNLSSLVMVLKDSGGATINTHSYTSGDLWFDPETPIAMLYPGPDAGVRTIEITLSSISANPPLYLGNLWIGKYIRMPSFLSDSSLSTETSSSFQQSRGGATFAIPGYVLEVFQCVFPAVKLTEKATVDAFYSATQNSYPLWLHRWEESPEFAPLYCLQTNPVVVQKAPEGGIMFDGLTLNFREAR